MNQSLRNQKKEISNPRNPIRSSFFCKVGFGSAPTHNARKSNGAHSPLGFPSSSNISFLFLFLSFFCCFGNFFLYKKFFQLLPLALGPCADCILPSNIHTSNYARMRVHMIFFSLNLLRRLVTLASGGLLLLLGGRRSARLRSSLSLGRGPEGLQ